MCPKYLGTTTSGKSEGSVGSRALAAIRCLSLWPSLASSLHEQLCEAKKDSHNGNGCWKPWSLGTPPMERMNLQQAGQMFERSLDCGVDALACTYDKTCITPLSRLQIHMLSITLLQVRLRCLWLVAPCSGRSARLLWGSSAWRRDSARSAHGERVWVTMSTTHAPTHPR